MDGYQVNDLLAGGLSVGLYIFCIFIAIFSVVVYWKIYTKAGEPGWAALIPFYNLYVQFKIIWGSGILFLLLLIPLANIIIALMMPFKLAKVFGRSAGFGFGLLFLPFIFYPILAFDSSEYVGVDPEQQQNPTVIQQQVFIQGPQPVPGYPPQVNSAYPQPGAYPQQPNSAYPQQPYPQGLGQPPHSAYPGYPYNYPQQPQQQPYQAYQQTPQSAYPNAFSQQAPQPDQNFPPVQTANSAVCAACGTANPPQTAVCQACGNRLA